MQKLERLILLMENEYQISGLHFATYGYRKLAKLIITYTFKRKVE